MTKTDVKPIRRAKSEKTEYLERVRNLLPDLVGIGNWVAYKMVPSCRRPGKTNKVPFDPHNNGKKARANDESTWGKFDQAAGLLLRHKALYGLGFQLGESADSKSGFVGIDLDDCVDENGQIAAWAKRIIDHLDCYTEVSPSGTGIRIFCRGQLPEGRRKQGNVEMYDSGRFLTVTGNQLDESPKTVEERTTELSQLHADVFGESKQPRGRTAKSSLPPSLDDQKLLKVARNARNGPQFKRLWRGDIGGYESQSEADLALCSHLAFYADNDSARVDRLFRQSSLMRPKWDERHSGDGMTYGEMTVAKAIASTTKTYQGNLQNSAISEETREAPRLADMLAQVDDLPADRDERRARILEIADHSGHLRKAEWVRLLNVLSEAGGVTKGDLRDVYKEARQKYRARATEVPIGERPSSWPYAVEEGRIVFHAPAGVQPVADFEARISHEIRTEAGRKVYRIIGTAKRGGPFKVEIAAEKFNDKRALKAALGAAVGPLDPVLVGMSKHLAPAISRLSDDVVGLRRYERVGWADGRFLIRGRLPAGYQLNIAPKLPYSVKGGELRRGLDALEALLLSVGPERTAIILAAAFQAPIARLVGWENERYAVMMVGPTGTLKTSTAQAVMCLYGRDFAQDINLIKWGEGATRNARMTYATQAADMPILFDNYKPNTESRRGFVKLLHNVLEGGNKDRLNRNSELRPTDPVHCFPIITGEDIPETDVATLARLLAVRFDDKSDGVNAHLAKTQGLVAHLPAVGRAWLDWLENEKDTIRQFVLDEFDDRRQWWVEYLIEHSSDIQNSRRIGTNLATNQLTWELVCRHPDIGPIVRGYWEDHKDGLMTTIGDMWESSKHSAEAQRFLSGLRELLSTGRVVLRDLKQGRNVNGDRPEEITRDQAAEQSIGWIDDEGSAFISPDVARAALTAHLGDELNGISSVALYRQLGRLGVLASTDKTRRTLTKSIDGKSLRVLHLKPSAFDA